MKALAKLKAEPGIWLTDVPEPSMGPHEVLIKIHKTAICGTDVHIYHWDDWAKKHLVTPIVTGHEFIGKIVEIGSEVTHLKIGDRVSGEGHIACGLCRNCRAGRKHLCRKNISVGVTRTGCFAEYLVIPADNAYQIPDSIPDLIATILDPLGNATHTALSFNLVGEDILITGAGPVGLMAAAIAKRVGARHIVVTDINDYRLALAKQMGATIALNPMRDSLQQTMEHLNMTEGFDVGLEVSGNPQAFNSMLEVMNHAGCIALLGFLPTETTIDWNHIILKGLKIKGIYGREMFETWYKMISLLESGLDIAPVITHEFAIADYAEAFTIMATGKSGKVILDWS